MKTGIYCNDAFPKLRVALDHGLLHLIKCKWKSLSDSSTPFMLLILCWKWQKIFELQIIMTAFCYEMVTVSKKGNDNWHASCFFFSLDGKSSLILEHLKVIYRMTFSRTYTIWSKVCRHITNTYTYITIKITYFIWWLYFSKSETCSCLEYTTIS